MITPASYVCEKCGASGVKLWRPANNHEPLRCRACAEPEQARAIACYAGLNMSARDTIGDLLPAVPVGDTFWGYTSVPDEGVQWWNALPDKPDPRDAEIADLRSRLAAEGAAHEDRCREVVDLRSRNEALTLALPNDGELSMLRAVLDELRADGCGGYRATYVLDPWLERLTNVRGGSGV